MRNWVYGLLAILLMGFGAASCAGCQKKNTPQIKIRKQPDKPPPTAGGERGPLSFELMPGHSKVLSDQSSKLHVLLRLSGIKVNNGPRPPLHLGVVVDRSGSMTRDKISSVKVAAIELIKRMSENDRVTLVSYSNDVEVHQQGVPADDKWLPILRNQVLGIQAGGMTALGPALLDTLGLLDKDDPEQDQLSHVILLSDGLANVGVTSPDILGRRTSDAFGKGISVSTLGVGVDYNEDLMTHLADQGGGNYHFVQDTQNITTVLNDELKGLVATVARNIEVEIPNGKGIELSKSYGYSVRREKGRTFVKIGSMRSGQNRDILLEFQIDPSTRSKFQPGQFQVHFKDTSSKDNSLRSMMAELEFDTTNDPNVLAHSENTEVAVLAAEMKSAEKLEGAARAVESGDFDSAQVILSDSIDLLKTQARKTPDTKLEKQIQSMQTAINDLDDAKQSFGNRKAYIKNKKAQSYMQKKKSYKKKDPQARDEEFQQTLKQIETKRRRFHFLWKTAKNHQLKNQIINRAEQFVFDAVVKDIFPYWIGVPWTMAIVDDGLKPDARSPFEKGKGISCSFFVTSVLQNAGLRLVNRRDFAGAISLHAQRSLTPSKHQLKRFYRVSPAQLREKMLKLGDGLYLVGLNYHIGFIVVKKDKVRFVHSSYLGPAVVVDEPIEESEAIALSQDAGYVVTSLFKDKRLARYWITGMRVPFTPKKQRAAHASKTAEQDRPNQ